MHVIAQWVTLWRLMGKIANIWKRRVKVATPHSDLNLGCFVATGEKRMASFAVALNAASQNAGEDLNTIPLRAPLRPIVRPTGAGVQWAHVWWLLNANLYRFWTTDSWTRPIALLRPKREEVNASLIVTRATN